MIKAAIMEVNPFHNGHAYFLSQIPKEKNDILIVIVSTSIVQRGEFTILNKHDKARLLLDNAADIVIALPSIYANQGGDYFAEHAIRILNDLNIDILYFGSETNNLDFLKQTEFKRTNNFTDGIYKVDNEKFNANDILGVSYIKAISKINPEIEVSLIKRINNNYNDTTIESSIASATSIRQNLNKPELLQTVMPSLSQQAIQKIDQDLLFNLFIHNLSYAIDNKLNIFLSEQGQLLIRLARTLKKYPEITNFSDLASTARDKNNSQYKYQRVMINTIFLTTDEFDLSYDFIHLLGFSKKGQQYIKSLNKPEIITSLKHRSTPLAQLEKRITQTYNILTHQQINHDYLPPIINYDKINE